MGELYPLVHRCGYGMWTVVEHLWMTLLTCSVAGNPGPARQHDRRFELARTDGAVSRSARWTVQARVDKRPRSSSAPRPAACAEPDW